MSLKNASCQIKGKMKMYMYMGYDLFTAFYLLTAAEISMSMTYL